MGVEPEESAHDLDSKVPTVAFIHEDMCIGCTKCIQACPVDAIVGGTKPFTRSSKTNVQAATCVAPCPTDCIEMIPVETTTDSWKWQLNAIPVVNITDAARDAANVKDSIK